MKSSSSLYTELFSEEDEIRCLQCEKLQLEPNTDVVSGKYLLLWPSTPTWIICLGRLRIACRCMFSLWQLRQGVKFVGSNPTIGGKFFSCVSFLCYNFHVVRWGLGWDWTFLCRKWLYIIINDDFLEMGECYDLAFLPRLSTLADYA